MTNNPFRGYAWLLTISGALFLSTACNQNERNPEDTGNQTDSLRHLLEEERNISDSLLRLSENKGIASPPQIFFGREFKDIEDPEAFVKNSLIEQPELISLDPVLGGKMEFRQITVLTDQWVMAYYDDGHIQGKAIYEYHLQPNDSLTFEEIATDHPR